MFFSKILSKIFFYLNHLKNIILNHLLKEKMNLENNSKNSISKELFLLYEKRKFIVIFLYDIIKQETLKNIL